jgi:hypothetical protein
MHDGNTKESAVNHGSKKSQFFVLPHLRRAVTILGACLMSHILYLMTLIPVLSR